MDAPQPIILRKRKFVRRMVIDRAGGQVKFDRFRLPSTALFITGIQVSARHMQLNPTAITTLHYRYGTLAATSADAQAVLTLTDAVYADTHPNWQVTAGPGEYIYYAYPASLSDPYFVYQTFQGGFLDQGTVLLPTANGPVTYRLWRSTNANLGVGVSITSYH